MENYKNTYEHRYGAMRHIKYMETIVYILLKLDAIDNKIVRTVSGREFRYRSK